MLPMLTSNCLNMTLAVLEHSVSWAKLCDRLSIKGAKSLLYCLTGHSISAKHAIELMYTGNSFYVLHAQHINNVINAVKDKCQNITRDQR